MANAPAKFRQIDVTRAAKAAAKAGMAVELLPDGTIRLVHPPVDNHGKPVEPPREIIL